MSEAKFTPGPWKAVWDDELQRHVVDANRDGVCDCCPINNEDMENARLIASAPDLYAALQASTELLQQLDKYTQSYELAQRMPAVIGAATAALAKAKGGEK